MHLDPAEHLQSPPDGRHAPTLGAVSDDVLERAGVSRAAVEATDAFLAVMGAMRDHLGQVAASMDVTPPMLLTLRMLEQPLPQRDIAARIGCDPSYVTSLIDRLEGLEAVERTPDPDDRRVNRIVLTDRGQQLRAEVAVDLLRDMPLVRGLDDEQLTTLHQLLLQALAAGGEMTVRRVVDEDAEALRTLIGGVFAEYPGCVLDPDGLDADLAAWATHLDERGGDGWVVVDDEDQVVACVGVAPTSDDVPGVDAGAVELKRLYVAAPARRRGLGRALVARVESWARDHGAGAVVLWSDTRFDDAHRLYERCGYRRTGRARQLHDPSDTTEDEFVHVLAPH